MKKAMLITDLTRMSPPWVCVGGYWRDLTAVRPKLQHRHGLTEHFLFHGGRLIIRPFAMVELDFLEAVPEPPHTEDWFVGHGYKALEQVRLPDEQAFAFLQRILDPDVTSIFDASVHTEHGCYVKSGEGSRSLGTILPKRLAAVQYICRADSKWDYRIAFVDQSGTGYRLAVTDLTFRHYCDYQRLRGRSPKEVAADIEHRLRGVTVFLRIGLARGWKKFPDRCYLQITGVHSFPDYLEGRCFDDFDLSRLQSPSPGDLAGQTKGDPPMFKQYRQAYDEMETNEEIQATRNAIQLYQAKLTELEMPYRDRMKEAAAAITAAVLETGKTTTLFGVVARFFKGRTSVSWKAVANALNPPDELIERYTRTGQPRVQIAIEVRKVAE